MCGIWLYLRKHNSIQTLTDAEIYASFKKLTPRGPEYQSLISLPNYGVYIGFTRLAIMDVTTRGDQPFIIETEQKITYTICNGEIYNYEQLQHENNFDLKSGSDCEVLPHLYEKYGSDMIDMLDGEFAFCICEINKKTFEVKLFIGRDNAGIRPLYLNGDENEIVLSSELKACPFLLPYEIYETKKSHFKVSQFKPRNWLSMSNLNDLYVDDLKYNEYYNIVDIQPTIFDKEIAFQQIRDTFTKAVEKRMMSDRPIGCLLSGGLDSSLVAAIASKICKKNGTRLHTFSIGMDGSTDEIYAKQVAEHIGSIHTHVKFDEHVWLQAINHIIQIVESYDVTTIRATTGQYLLAKWISENTLIKSLLNGDGSDESFGGYRYFLKAPSPKEYHLEILKLISEIHMYDVQRSDRGTSDNGIEARVPFLDRDLIKLVLSIDPQLRMPQYSDVTKTVIEKWLLREAFRNTDLLPLNVLFREKEAFSDGVSSLKRSWYKIIQERIDELIDDNEFEIAKKLYKHCVPTSKEALYFRRRFESLFGDFECIPHYWLPNWMGNITEPSARVLPVYLGNNQ